MNAERSGQRKSSSWVPLAVHSRPRRKPGFTGQIFYFLAAAIRASWCTFPCNLELLMICRIAKPSVSTLRFTLGLVDFSRVQFIDKVLDDAMQVCISPSQQ